MHIYIYNIPGIYYNIIDLKIDENHDEMVKSLGKEVSTNGKI